MFCHSCLTSKEIDNYFVRYLGRQNADEIPCYVFAVKPKTMEQGKRYFDRRDLGGRSRFDDCEDLWAVHGILKKGTDQQFPEIRDLPGADRREILVPDVTRSPTVLHFKDAAILRIS